MLLIKAHAHYYFLDVKTDSNDPFTNNVPIGLSQKDVNALLGSNVKAQDPLYISFLSRMAVAKDQVLRYDRGGMNPLWLHSRDVVTSEAIPPCSCGAPRAFECQLMPQLLFYVQKETSMEMDNDWGTFVLYTCTESCAYDPMSTSFVEEYVYHQVPAKEESVEEPEASPDLL